MSRLSRCHAFVVGLTRDTLVFPPVSYVHNLKVLVNGRPLALGPVNAALLDLLPPTDAGVGAGCGGSSASGHCSGTGHGGGGGGGGDEAHNAHGGVYRSCAVVGSSAGSVHCHHISFPCNPCTRFFVSRISQKK